MTKFFNVTYQVHGQEKEGRFDYIPEEISADPYKLSIYLAQKIAKQERVKEDDILINAASCVFKS